LLKKMCPVLLDDAGFLAVAKPPGVDVGALPGTSTPGLVDVLEQTRGGPLFVTHRLSRYESGVLLLARSEETARHVRAGLRTHRVEQIYLAVVEGAVKKQHRQRSARPRPADEEGVLQLELLREGGHRFLVGCHAAGETTHGLRARLRAASIRVLGDRRGEGQPAASSGPGRPDGSPPGARRAGTSARRRSAGAASLLQTRLHLASMTFFHPAQRRRVRLSARPPAEFEAPLEGRRDTEWLLAGALARRLACLAESETEVYRLITGRVEGIPGVVGERYGEVVVVQLYENEARLTPEVLRVIARWWQKVLRVRAVYVKRHVRGRLGAENAVRREVQEAQPFVGEEVPEEIVVSEGGFRFAVRPYDGFNVGLFPDHRENRRRIRDMSEGKDVLNLFAYTCGFSVAAAVGGARGTVSVDLSPRSLEWGKRNFALNELEMENHLFIRSDARRYFERARRQERSFDLMVIDAPTFAHGTRQGQDFSLERDLSTLIGEALGQLRRGGIIMLATNHRRLSRRWLIEQAQSASGRRPCRVHLTPEPPVDYDADPAHSRTVFLEFS
jgi:23S rRNA (cytosine1962-C5)-methyltransferase